MSVRFLVNHEWRDLVEGEDQTVTFFRAEKPGKTSVDVSLNVIWSYDPTMAAQKCKNCGMMSFNGDPESKDPCDISVVRQVMES